jgi:hypothetical protein
MGGSAAAAGLLALIWYEDKEESTINEEICNNQLCDDISMDGS